MKTNKFWIKAPRTIRFGGETKEVSILAGSNVSTTDAESKADAIAETIQKKIDAKRSNLDYESEIKEWISETLDDDNVVTVNRYGAQVWNTTAYTILDLDDFPFEFMDFFGATRGIDKKTLILERFKKKLAKSTDLGSDLRIYETAKGYRVIAKAYLSPQESRFRGVMSRYKVDRLYSFLCTRQDCYRARLTPKPFRIQQKPIRIKLPMDCQTETYASWNAEYERKSRSYSVVKLIDTIGSDFSSDPAVAYHDKVCHCGSSNPLA